MNMEKRVWRDIETLKNKKHVYLIFSPLEKEKKSTQITLFFFFGGGEVQLLVFGSVHSEDSEHVEIGWSFQVHVQNSKLIVGMGI